MKPFDVTKPWGSFREFTLNQVSTVKIISVKKGGSLSLQTHKNRDEFWRVLSGDPTIVIGEQSISASPNQEFSIPREIQHRILAEKNDVEILEIATGDFNEKDITRLADNYNRV